VTAPPPQPPQTAPFLPGLQNALFQTLPASFSIADDALLQSLWQSPYPATLQDEHFRLLRVNDAYAALVGHSAESLIGIDPLDLQPAEDRDANQAARDSYPSLHAPVCEMPTLHRRMKGENGQLRWCSLVMRRVHTAQGQPLWLSVLQDLTAEHAARDEGRRAQDELALWFELCPVGMLVFDDSGAVIRTNPAFEDLVGRVLMSLADADADLQWLLGWQPTRAGQAARAERGPLERSVTVALPDGRRRRLLARLRSLPSDDGYHRSMVVVEDRSAEEERDVARMEIGVLMDAASIGVATFDPARGWLQPHAGSGAAGVGSAPQTLAASRQTSRGLQGINRDVVEADSLPEYERLQTALRKRERAEARYAVNHPDSGRRWLLTRVEPAHVGDGSAARTTMSVVTLDITEQELARQRNEQLLRELTTILDGSTAGIAYLRGDVLVRCNLRFERMLGFRAGDAAGVTLREAFGRRFEAEPLLANVATALSESGAYECELQTRGAVARASAAGAAPAWYSLSVRRARSDADGAVNSPAVTEAVAVLTDITRLKTQQSELEEVLRERELMFSLSEVGIAYMRGSRIERANQAMAVLTGYSAPELTALDGAELYESARECIEFEAALGSALRQSGRYLGERRLRCRDGRLVWVQVAVRPVDDEDHAAGLIASFVDVDERHRARESLMQQADRTRAVLDSVLVGIVNVSARGIEWMNRSARRMFGGELADFVGEDIATVATAEADHPLRRSAQYLQRPAEGQAETFECRLMARDGRQFWVVGSVVATGQPGAGPQLTYALLDIERRRQAEVSIAQAQASLQRIIETAPLAIALFDARSHRVLQLNQMTAAFFARPVADVQNKLLEECLSAPRAATVRGWLEAAALTPEVLHREWLDMTEGAATRVWDVRIVALAASDVGAAQLLLVASDVTEQREADEARLRAAIAQRELLVREVHHRIKNNLQGVAGLLQQNAFRHPEIATLLGEAVSQVQAIAQVYGLQVGGDGPLRVPQVLSAIAASVQRTFGRTIDVDAGDAALAEFVLPEAEAIPIALTLNELLTNAVKHGQGDSVRCGVQEHEGGVRLHIANLGKLPEGFNLDRFPGGVAGLGLVRALLPRRSATLNIEQQGNEVVVHVSLREPSVRRQIKA
jgi:PAS domain S-box-containing protein